MTERQELPTNVPQSQFIAAQEAQSEVDSCRIAGLTTNQEPFAEIWDFEDLNRIGLPSVIRESATAIRARHAHVRSMSACVIVAFCGLYLSTQGAFDVLASSELADEQIRRVGTNRPERFEGVVESQSESQTRPHQINFGNLIPAAFYSTDRRQEATTSHGSRTVILDGVATSIRDCSLTIMECNGADFKAVLTFDTVRIYGTGKVEGGKIHFETEQNSALDQASIGQFNRTTIDIRQPQTFCQSNDETANEIDWCSVTTKNCGDSGRRLGQPVACLQVVRRVLRHWQHAGWLCHMNRIKR